MSPGILTEQVEEAARRLGYSPICAGSTDGFLRSLIEDSASVCVVDTAVAPLPLAALVAILEGGVRNGAFAMIALIGGDDAVPATRSLHLRLLLKPFAPAELESTLLEFRDLPPADFGKESRKDPVGYWFGALGNRILRDQRQPRLALKIVSDLSTAKELQALLGRLLQNVRDVVPAEQVVIFLLNEKRTELQALVGHGASPHILKELRTPLTPGRLLSSAVASTTRGMTSIGRAPAEDIVREYLHPTEFAVAMPLDQVFEVEGDAAGVSGAGDAGDRFAIVHYEPLAEAGPDDRKKTLVRRYFGALFFDNPYSRQPVRIDDYTVLEMVIRTSAMVVNDILLAEGLNRRIAELAVLTQASEWVSQTLDVQETLQAIIRAVTDGLKCERGSVMLLQGTDELIVRAYSGSREESIIGKVVRVGEGLAGWVVENRKPLLVKDLEKDPVFHRQSRPSYVTRSAIIAPLELDGELLGVINVSDKLDGKPFDEGDLSLLVAIANHAVIALKNARLYGELKDSYFQTVRSLAQALDAKDPYTKGHSDRVAEYTVMIAAEMAQKAGIPPEELELLRVAGILHDVGKIGVPESVLLKPGRLTEEEFKQIQKHAEQGDTIVQPIRFLDPVRGAVRSHHERFSGGGYPDNLVGNEIPLYARIMAVADAFDAMTTSRSYRRGLPVDEAVKRLEEGIGSQFDPAVVDAFKSLVAKAKIQPLIPDQE
jgi:HD-GYP domain-containing protein (c-di-GMP phosphodiesterase class II)